MRDALHIARAAAQAGGRELVARREDVGQIRSKGSSTDFVSDADVASGIAAVGAILTMSPGARVVVEEDEVYEAYGIEPATLDGDVWLVDPLDGTTSFVHGFPCYSVSVAFARDGVPVAGAVLNAATGELFSAAQGLGATRDGHPIQCSSASRVTDSLVVTGFPYDRGEPLDRQLRVLTAFLRAPIHGMRRDGSAAVDCTHVASGRADGFWEYALKPWDMAAGAIICREAGAIVTDVAGTEWTAESTSILTANPALHPRMAELIASAGGS